LGKTLLFIQFRCQAQILILEILYVCLRLKLSPSLNLNKNQRFANSITFLFPGNEKFSVPPNRDGKEPVSNSEMSNFSQGQGNRRIARRRTQLYAAEMKKHWYLLRGVSNSQIRYFIEKQGRTRVFAEMYI